MSVVIKGLSNKTSTKPYTFSDIYLDFEETQKSTDNRSSNVTTGNDLLIATDQEAIKNSVRNILLQRRYLNPGFGANLRGYIGLSLSEMGAKSIGDIIDRNLNLYEPRITVDKILVAPDYDRFTYAIVIIYRFKNFINDRILLNGEFNAGSGDFYFIK